MITVTLIGRLTKDATLKYTDQGKPVANFTIACPRKRVDKDGNKQTTYLRCVLWGKPAEVLTKYSRKGSLVGAFGELMTRQYDDQQGHTHYVTEMLVDSFEFLETKQTTQEREEKTKAANSTTPNDTTVQEQRHSEHEAAFSELEASRQPPMDGLTPFGTETARHEE